MFPTYQQVPYVLIRRVLVANRPPLLRTVRLLHFVTGSVVNGSAGCEGKATDRRSGKCDQRYGLASGL